MGWASLGAAVAKAFAALFAWLGDKQLIDAGRAAAKGEADAKARETDAEIARRRADPVERERVAREIAKRAAN